MCAAFGRSAPSRDIRPESLRIALFRVATVAQLSRNYPVTMPLRSWTVGVSFVRTPLAQISAKVEQIESLGWREYGRGDPWVATFQKDLPEEVRDVEAELRGAMGDYWLDADAIAEPRASK
jgi:hypothetical protein